MGWSQHVVCHLPSLMSRRQADDHLPSLIYQLLDYERALKSGGANSPTFSDRSSIIAAEEEEWGRRRSMLDNDASDADVEEDRDVPRLRTRHALSIKPWKTACLPASRHLLPSLPLVWVWELLGKVAMAAEGAPGQSPVTSPTAVSSVRILLRRLRRKNCSMSVVDLTMTAEKVMRPPQTRSVMKRVPTSFRLLPTLLVLPSIVTLSWS
jgi:hypothetical protein